MTRINVTIDNYDPLVGYTPAGAWHAPDPSAFEDTYHSTTVFGAKASINFTGSSIWVYGAAGSGMTNYSVTIDPLSREYYNASFSATNSTNGARTLLYSTRELTYADHTLEIANLGSGFALDSIVLESEVGAEGAALSNTTWNASNQSEVFAAGAEYDGGAEIKLFEEGSSACFSFAGSAVYVFGDSSLDQGPYAVYLNASGAPLSSFTPAATLSGRSQGCDRNSTSACLKQGALKYYSALPWGTHELKVVKLGNSSVGVVGLSWFTFTTASSEAYAFNTTSNSSCPFVSCDGRQGIYTNTNYTAPGSSTKTSGAAGLGARSSIFGESGMVWVVLGLVWAVRRYIV